MKKLPVFYKIYFSVIAIFAVLLTVLLILLNGWLGNYQAAQPETLVNGIITDYIEKNDFEALNDISPLEVSPYETQENLNAYLASIASDKEITAASSINRDESSDLAYTIKAGDEKILNVFLKKSKNSSDLLSTYEISGISLPDDIYKTIEIVVPAGAEVKINGVTLREEDMTAVEIPTFPEKYNAGISCGSTAKIEKLISDEAAVTASYEGNPLTVTKEDGKYYIAQHIDEATIASLSDFAKAASETYSARMQNDSSLSAIRKYFATDTPFYENLSRTDVSFALDHDGFRFENTEVKEIYRYSDNLYRCRVTLTQVLVKNRTEYTDHFDKYLYIYVNGDTLSVIDLVGTGEAE